MVQTRPFERLKSVCGRFVSYNCAFGRTNSSLTSRAHSFHGQTNAIDLSNQLLFIAKASAAAPRAEDQGGWEGHTYAKSKVLETKNIRCIRSQNSMLWLTSKFCMLTFRCTKRATDCTTESDTLFCAATVNSVDRRRLFVQKEEPASEWSASGIGQASVAIKTKQLKHDKNKPHAASVAQ